MTLESVQKSIRQALEATAPSDAEILARMRQARVARASRAAAKTARQRPGTGMHPFMLAALALCGLLLLWQSGQLDPSKSRPELTRETWVPDKTNQTISRESTHAQETEVPRPARTEERSPQAPADEPHHLAAKAAKATAPSRSSPARTAAPQPEERSSDQPPLPQPTDTLRSAPPTWEDVAQAMREGNDEQARTLIQRLEQSPDAETRDNARLAELQLSLSLKKGDVELSPQHRAELEDLRNNGATSSIRAAARRLLRQPAPPTKLED